MPGCGDRLDDFAPPSRCLLEEREYYWPETSRVELHALDSYCNREIGLRDIANALACHISGFLNALVYQDCEYISVGLGRATRRIDEREDVACKRNYNLFFPVDQGIGNSRLSSVLSNDCEYGLSHSGACIGPQQLADGSLGITMNVMNLYDKVPGPCLPDLWS